MSYPPKPWKPDENLESLRSLLSNGIEVDRDFRPQSRQNIVAILRDSVSEPHSTWLPKLRLESRNEHEITSLVPKVPTAFAREIEVGGGKVFLDEAGRIVQINRANNQRFAFSYSNEKIRQITANRSISVTSDDTNWFYDRYRPNDLPDWKGRVEAAQDGTVTVSRLDEKDVYRIDGTHSIECTDNTRIDFNADDRLTEVVAANGRKITLGYSYAGEMLSMTDSRGTYTTRNGHEWFRPSNINAAPKRPDWLGTVSYSHDGRVSELSDAGLYKCWNFDGTAITHYRNGRHIDTDKDGHVTRIVDAKNRTTSFKYDAAGKMIEMCDIRGAYSTTDGANWFKSTNTSRAQPDWRGSVSVSADSGLITERNSDNNSVARWTLNGRHLTYDPLLPVTEFSSKALQLFPLLDKDKNDYLSGIELGHALEDPQFTGRDAQVIAALYKCRDDLKKLSDDETFSESEVCANDLRKFDELAKRKDKVALVERVEWYLERTNNSQKDNLPCTLYLDEANPCTSITHKAIAQGTIGDCYLEAVIASIAASSPGKIQQMIKDNGDGTYTVTFPGDKAHPITVAAPTEAEMGLNAEPSEYGIWPNVLEKAFGEYFVENSYFRTRGYSSTEGADGGGFASRSTKLLTGKNADEYWCSEWRSSATNQIIKNELTAAFAEGRAVTCSIGSIRHGQTKDGFTKRHVYSIIGWDPNGKGGGTLVIRNPWGNKTVGPGGTSTMTYQQYLNNFNVITIEGR